MLYYRRPDSIHKLSQEEIHKACHKAAYGTDRQYHSPVRFTTALATALVEPHAPLAEIANAKDEMTAIETMLRFAHDRSAKPTVDTSEEVHEYRIWSEIADFRMVILRMERNEKLLLPDEPHDEDHRTGSMFITIDADSKIHVIDPFVHNVWSGRKVLDSIGLMVHVAEIEKNPLMMISLDPMPV